MAVSVVYTLLCQTLFLYLFTVVTRYIRFSGRFLPSTASSVIVSKIVSSIHSVILVSLSCFYLLEWMDLDVWKNLQCIPVGYCIYDTLLYFGDSEMYLKGNRLTPLHHALFAFFTVFYFDEYPVFLTIGYLSEITNPFLHISTIIILTDKKEEYLKVFYMSSLVVLGSFLIFRVGVFGYFVWYSAMYVGFLPFLAASVIWGMNVYWFGKLVRIARNNKVV
jgi:hypothetical protein